MCKPKEIEAVKKQIQKITSDEFKETLSKARRFENYNLQGLVFIINFFTDLPSTEVKIITSENKRIVLYRTKVTQEVIKTFKDEAKSKLADKDYYKCVAELQQTIPNWTRYHNIVFSSSNFAPFFLNIENDIKQYGRIVLAVDSDRDDDTFIATTEQKPVAMNDYALLNEMEGVDHNTIQSDADILKEAKCLKIGAKASMIGFSQMQEGQTGGVAHIFFHIPLLKSK